MLRMLDTDMASYVVKGHSATLETKFASLPADQVCISAVTRAELLYGLKRLAPEHRINLVVHQFLRLMPVFAWDSDAADYYADIRHQLVSEGQPIGELDMMIAAHALAAGATLVTNNVRHFGRIRAPLIIENWLD